MDCRNRLRDYLPTDISNTRIFSWGYNVNTHSVSRVNAQYLYDHATTLVADLVLERRLTTILPEVFQNCGFEAGNGADRKASYYLHRA